VAVSPWLYNVWTLWVDIGMVKAFTAVAQDQ
jgi:hypothetical protein